MGGGWGEQLPGGGGALAPLPHTKIDTLNIETKKQRIFGSCTAHRKDEAGSQRLGWTCNSLTSRGQKEPGYRLRAGIGAGMDAGTAAGSGMWSGAQRQAATSGRWQVWVSSRWTALRFRRGSEERM